MGFGLPPRFEDRHSYPVDSARLARATEDTFEALNWTWERRADGSYLAKVGTTWRSWGERIVAVIEPEGSVHVSSRSWWPGTVIDWGKNAINVAGFFQQLGMALRSHS